MNDDSEQPEPGGAGRRWPYVVGGVALLVAAVAPVCDGAEAAPAIVFDTQNGAYQGQDLRGYLIDADCLRAVR